MSVEEPVTDAERGRKDSVWHGQKRFIITIIGCLLVLGIGTTSAFMNDSFNLNLAANGIGADRFDIAVVTSEGLVSSADPADGIAMPLEGESTFIPGRTMTADISVFNNSPTLKSSIQVVVEPVGDGQVGEAPNITPQLRFTIVNNSTGELVVGGSVDDSTQGVPIDDATGIVGILEQRGAPALTPGNDWSPGVVGADRYDITVKVHYLDGPETEALNGGRSAIKVRLVGTSTD